MEAVMYGAVVSFSVSSPFTSISVSLVQALGMFPCLGQGLVSPLTIADGSPAPRKAFLGELHRSELATRTGHKHLIGKGNVICTSC